MLSALCKDSRRSVLKEASADEGSGIARTVRREVLTEAPMEGMVEEAPGGGFTVERGYGRFTVEEEGYCRFTVEEGGYGRFTVEEGWYGTVKSFTRFRSLTLPSEELIDTLCGIVGNEPPGLEMDLFCSIFLY